MMLVSVDDYEEGISILAYRMSKEYPSTSHIWIGGEAIDRCMALARVVNGGFVKVPRFCTDTYFAYCEFNGEIEFLNNLKGFHAK